MNSAASNKDPTGNVNTEKSQTELQLKAAMDFLAQARQKVVTMSPKA